MSYEFFYAGTPGSLEPTYGDAFTGYRMAASNLGSATDPRTANQLQEVSNKLNVGTKTMEISMTQPDVFESIPQQHLKEINRLGKLTGVEPTFHAPLIEASGYAKEGWDEAGRKQAEKQIWSAFERSHELRPDGNINVTVHSSAMLPQAQEIMKEAGVESTQSILLADPRTGEIRQIKRQEKSFPEYVPEKYKEAIKKDKFIPDLEIERWNKEQWTRALNNLNFYASRGSQSVDSVLGRLDTQSKDLSPEQIQEYKSHIFNAFKTGNVENIQPEDRPAVANALKELTHADLYLRDSYNLLKDSYNSVYKDANPQDKKKLDDFKKEIEESVKEGIEKSPEKMQEFANLIEQGVKVLGSIENPKMFIPLNNFLIDKTSETYSNVALAGWKKFKDTAPVLSIENPPAGGALSRAEELKQLIEKTREKFVDKAVEQGLGRGEAESAAKKLIGATWDVGHINMIRKYGYDKEDLIKEAEKIAPYAKHVHLSDNFGYEHTELPMGMGNVPIKQIMEKLGQEGFEGKKIIEAGNWFQHFKTSPFSQSLEAFGSPLYAMKAPYWNQIASTFGNYLAYPSAYLPEQHFSLYGGGFASLPTELGGQMPGKQSRVSGTPMD